MAEKLRLDFNEEFAPLVREFGLSDAVQGMVDAAEGPGTYADLRSGAGLTDLDLIKEYLELPKIDVPIQSLRSQGLTTDEILNIFVQDLGINEARDLANQGIKPSDFAAAFIKNRELAADVAAAEGVARGLTVGAPATGLMVAGATYGTPFGLPGILIGGGGGLLIGAGIGMFAEDQFFSDEPILEDQTRALLEGGKVLGEGLTMLAAPRAFMKIGEKALTAESGFLKKLGDSIRLRSFNLRENPVYQTGAMPKDMKYLQVADPVMFKFLNTYKKSPKMFQAAETGAIAGAAAGATGAELISPGDPYVRVPAEIGGGFASVLLNPFKWLPYYENFKEIALEQKELLGEATSESAVEKRVGMALVNFLLERGENPEDLIRDLRRPEFDKLIKDAEDLVDKTKRPLLAGVDIPSPNSRALTNSVTLELLEGRLRALNGRFGTEVQNDLDAQAQGVAKILKALRLTGGTNALKAAAVLRKRHFESLVEDRFTHAIDQANRATDKIKSVTPESRRAASTRVTDIIYSAFKDVNAQENALYKKVQGERVLVSEENLGNEIERLRGTLTKEQFSRAVDKIIRDTGQRLGDQTQAQLLDVRIATLEDFADVPGGTQEELDAVVEATGLRPNQIASELEKLKKQREQLGEVESDPPTFEQMNNLRGYLLEQSRLAASGLTPGMADKRVYDRLALAVLNDLSDQDKLVQLNGEELTLETLTAIDTARAFTKAKSDVFKRAFPNKIMANRATGEAFLQPELLYQSILRGTDDETILRLRDIDNAVKMLVNDLTPGGLAGDPTEELVASERLGLLSDSYDTVVRALAGSNLVNNQTGEVNQAGLANFLAKNEDTLSLMPLLKADLENASTRKTLLDSARQKKEKGMLKIRSSFNNLFSSLTGENPHDAINMALNSDKPAAEIRNLTNRLRAAARRSEKEGPIFVDGKRIEITVPQVEEELRDAFFQIADESSRPELASVGSPPDFAKFKSFFFATRGKNEPLIKTLTDKKVGLFSDVERVRLQQLLTAGEGAQKKIANPGYDIVEELESGMDVLTNLIVRATGAGLGQKASQYLPGNATLIAASGGSQAALKMLDKIPTTDTNKLLQKAIQEPEMMALLLEKGLITGERQSTKDVAKRLFNVRRLNAFINSALGTGAAEEIMTEELSPEEQAAIRQFEETPFGTQRPRGFGGLRDRGIPTPQPQVDPPIEVMGPPLPPALPTQAAAPANQQTRRRFAALYPDDPISPIIEAQGIGTLPQARG
mgnify:CR=1 FL=1